MSSRNRLLVLAISTPIIAFAFVGGYFGRAIAQDDTYQHLRVFEDVVSLVLNNYVEPVDVRDAMGGAMRGLADSLDPESAYLTPELVRSRESNDPGGPAEVGLDVTRQVLPARRVRSGRFTRGQGRYPCGRLHPGHRQPAHARHVGVRRESPAARSGGIQGLAPRHQRERSRPAHGRPGARAGRRSRTDDTDGGLHDRLCSGGSVLSRLG